MTTINESITVVTHRCGKVTDKESKILKKLASKVKSGDAENHEAQAAKLYWRALMGNDFRRDPTLEGVNSLLNYGYSIIRAMMARAIVAAGLHPSIGLHHCNQYNGLCLADDLMEPLRPWVDWLVYSLTTSDHCVTVNRQTKEILLGLLTQYVSWDEQSMPLMVAAHYLVAQFKQAYINKTFKIKYPQLNF